MEIIKRPRIEFAQNGFVVCWEVFGKENGSYDSERYIKDDKKVFEGFTPKSKMAAIDMFVELGKKAGCLSKMEDEEEEED